MESVFIFMVLLPFGALIWLLARELGNAIVPDDAADWIASRRKVRWCVRPSWLSTKSCAQLPATIGQLAAALAAGEDCRFALHDALEEAGRPELAVYFRDANGACPGWLLHALQQGDGP